MLLAGEILRKCKPFIEDNVHPQIIVRGVRKATQLALQKIQDIAVTVKKNNPEYVDPCNCLQGLDRFLAWGLAKGHLCSNVLAEVHDCILTPQELIN